MVKTKVVLWVMQAVSLPLTNQTQALLIISTTVVALTDHLDTVATNLMSLEFTCTYATNVEASRSGCTKIGACFG